MIRIAIADDHTLIRDGLKKLIEQQKDLQLVGEASTAYEAMVILRTSLVDVLVLDISLPDKDGIEVLKQIREEKISVRILMLSMHPENRYARRALKNGASAYLTKEQAATTICEAIRSIFHTGSYITEKVARELYQEITPSKETTGHQSLSDREYQIFLMIGQGIPISTIAKKLSISISTVNTYRKRILEKMSFTSNAEIITFTVSNNLLP